jgi:cyanophycinase
MSSSSIRSLVTASVLQRTIKGILWTFVAVGGCMVTVMGAELALLAKIQPSTSAARIASRPHAGGSLVICGGGSLPDDVRDRFVELAGGPKARLVIIPTANGAADTVQQWRDMEIWKSKGVASVLALHTRSREKANDAEFVKPLAEATGVWFSGGKQSLLSEAYVDTEVEKQLKALLNRGGVIGGTSAGAAAMTRIMITGGRTEASEGRGFDLLPGSIVDQHFMQRNRIGRLLGLLTKHPDLLGFGINESTALIVEGTHYTVMGKSYVTACVPVAGNPPWRIVFLQKGDHVDLASLKSPEVVVNSTFDFDELAQADTQ